MKFDMRYDGSGDGGETTPEMTPEALTGMAVAGEKAAKGPAKSTKPKKKKVLKAGGKLGKTSERTYTRRELEPSAFARAVKRARTKLGLTQAQLAAKIGCSASYLANFECGGTAGMGNFADKVRKVCGLKPKGGK